MSDRRAPWTLTLTGRTLNGPDSIVIELLAKFWAPQPANVTLQLHVPDGTALSQGIQEQSLIGYTSASQDEPAEFFYRVRIPRAFIQPVDLIRLQAEIVMGTTTWDVSRYFPEGEEAALSDGAEAALPAPPSAAVAPRWLWVLGGGAALLAALLLGDAWLRARTERERRRHALAAA